MKGGDNLFLSLLGFPRWLRMVFLATPKSFFFRQEHKKEHTSHSSLEKVSDKSL